MVSLTDVQASNSLISSTLPPGLIAIFVGATSGIGEATLLKFAKYARRPRVHFVGRSQDAADRILAACRRLNPEGEFHFIKADVSLMRVVDEVCEDIKAKEKVINILFTSQGVPSMDRSKTSEGIHLLAAINYYSRLRFITNLLPLIKSATSLRRVVVVAGGTKEGPIDATDFPALRIPLTRFRGHLCSMITLSLEAVAIDAPEVSFVHDYPGTVETTLIDRMPGLMGVILRVWVYLAGRWFCVPIDESGERHLYLATSARFPSKNDESDEGAGVGVSAMAVMKGKPGGGVCSVGWDCEPAPPAVIELLAGLREKGIAEQAWRHTRSEFERVRKRET